MGRGRGRMILGFGTLMLLLAASASAQTSSIKMDSKTPVEIAADTLEVLQNEKKAIFSGNVIATQGTIKMRAATMTVFYREAQAGTETPEVKPAADSDALGKGIYRIDADGNVIFTTPTETAQGTKAIYDVDKQTVTLTGDVTLTRGKNILKGTAMTYNLATGRSILNSQGAAPGTGRVRGLFVPSEGDKLPTATPKAQPKGTP
jgi:lipopolysaccharide export system protein LptA